MGIDVNYNVEEAIRAVDFLRVREKIFKSHPFPRI